MNITRRILRWFSPTVTNNIAFNGDFEETTISPWSDRPSEFELIAQLHERLTNQPPRDLEVINRLESVAASAKMLGASIILDCPDSRERSLALTALEESTMWARAAIARNQAAIPEWRPDDECGDQFCYDSDDHVTMQQAVEPRFIVVPDGATDDEIQRSLEALYRQDQA